MLEANDPIYEKSLSISSSKKKPNKRLLSLWEVDYTILIKIFKRIDKERWKKWALLMFGGRFSARSLKSLQKSEQSLLIKSCKNQKQKKL